ncbi:uncharacterized protein VAR608DRAFT_1536 [Variovorax sp. HW608]|uniref:TPM domain-containing protein n=1 Tax=Variovorax sp. HW608 TaxID=1034889 RepID=UPI000820148B|nr:YgcG family protein [Variovorax sp. HW608]SCK20660.1 uncharacterized protein VAR608DRAFT_1536 [Variovorax sp. HW608]
MRIAARALLVLGLLVGLLVQAQVPVPPLTARVTDQTGTLSAQQASTLEQQLAAFEARKGTQLAVLIVPTTGPEPIEQYALRVAEQWKLGRKNVDDAAILVVAKNDRALRIEVGYGLEGVLNDATAKRIISEIIVPQFRQQDFAGGISAGLQRMMSVIDGEPLPPPARRARTEGDDLPSYALAIVVAALILGSIARPMLGRVGGSVATGGIVAVVTWLMVGALASALFAGVLAFFVTLLGGQGLLPMVGRYGGFGNGRRGGFGGGGFRGGGGGFGGGGASGRW